MSDTLRAVALLLSVLLWSPVAPSLMSGQTGPEEAGLLYAAALCISLAGCGLMAALVRGYSPEPEPEPEQLPQLDVPAQGEGSAQEQERRRTENALSESAGQPR